MTAYTYEIIQDEDASNPRMEFDNVGTMVCFHNRYDLGDTGHGYSSGDFNSWAELKKAIIADNNGAIILPVYMYDHSGITISTRPFSCPWDSGQIGFIFCPREKAISEWGRKICTKKVREKAENYLRGEIKTYNQYLTGDVWGYVIEDEEGNHIESCFGFYGYDYCEEEAKSIIGVLESIIGGLENHGG